MSSRELIESLRRGGQDTLLRMKEEAEQEAAALQTAANGKLGDLRRQQAARLAAAVSEDARRSFADAGNRARALKLSAEKRLADRLVAIAWPMLRALRDEGYPAVFERLAQELPPLPWKLVRVNPGDAALAGKYFPEAEIMPVEAISGGLDAATDDGV